MIFSLTAFFLFNEELLQQGKFVFMTLQFKEQDDSEGIGDKIKKKRCSYSERRPTRWRLLPGRARDTLRVQKFWLHPQFASSKKRDWYITLQACFYFRLSHHLMFLGLAAFSGDFGEQTCSSCRSKKPPRNQTDRWYFRYLKSQHLILADSHNVLLFPRVLNG